MNFKEEFKRIQKEYREALEKRNYEMLDLMSKVITDPEGRKTTGDPVIDTMLVTYRLSPDWRKIYNTDDHVEFTDVLSHVIALEERLEVNRGKYVGGQYTKGDELHEILGVISNSGLVMYPKNNNLYINTGKRYSDWSASNSGKYQGRVSIVSEDMEYSARVSYIFDHPMDLECFNRMKNVLEDYNAYAPSLDKEQN